MHAWGQYYSYPPHSCLLSRRIHPNIIPQHFGAVCCVICWLLQWIISPPLPSPPHSCNNYSAFHSSTTSPPFRSNPAISNDILCIWSTMEPPKHSSCWLMGYFQYPTFYTVKCCVSDNKAAALIPGATHDRRAATERLPESADEIGSAARRGCRSGWRSSMMNEATDVRPCCRCFLLCLCVISKCSRAAEPVHSLLQGSIPSLLHFLSWFSSKKEIEIN